MTTVMQLRHSPPLSPSLHNISTPYLLVWSQKEGSSIAPSSLSKSKVDKEDEALDEGREDWVDEGVLGRKNEVIEVCLVQDSCFSMMSLSGARIIGYS